jgi:hypothetical protein
LKKYDFFRMLIRLSYVTEYVHDKEDNNSAVGNGVGSFYSMRAKAVVDNHRGMSCSHHFLNVMTMFTGSAIAQIDFTHQGAMKVAH